MALWSSQPHKSLPGGGDEEELAENYFFGTQILHFSFLFLGRGL